MDRAAADAARARLPKTKTPVAKPKVTQTNPGLSPDPVFIKEQIAKNKKASGAPAAKAATPAPKPSYAERRTAMKEVLEGYRAEKKASATTPAATPKKAATDVPKPKAKPSYSKGSSSPPAYTPEKAKPQLGKKVTSGFSGNWTGAAPTEMQKRGGAKISRGGGLLGAIKRKMGGK